MSDKRVPDSSGQGTTALTQAADQVAVSADALTEQLKALRVELHDAMRAAEDSVEAAKKKAAQDVAAERRDRRYAGYKFALVVVLDIVLSLVSLGLWYSQEQTNNRLQTSLRENYTTAQQQDRTRVRVLCPLYTLLLDAAQSPTPRTPDTPAQQEQVAKAVKTIQDGYATLGCTPKLPTMLPSG